MATQHGIRLPLCQVLEEEYTSVYGPLEDASPTVPEETEEHRLSRIHQCLHARKPAALCLSGGGIRSATFGLGVLQGLASHGLLDTFDYLSTVSGGGYVGSWLTAWVHHQGLQTVTG